MEVSPDWSHAQSTEDVASSSSTATPKNVFQLRKDDIHRQTSSSTKVSRDQDLNIIVLDHNSNDQNQPLNTETDKDTECDEIIMSAFWRNGKFAAAYYNIETSEIHILNEINDLKPDHKMLMNLYKQAQPVIVITDSRTPATFIDTLKMLILERSSISPITNNTNDSMKLKWGLNFIPKKEYNFESCKRRIYTLSLPNEPKDISENNRELFLHSVIDFRYPLTVYALGALLKYLDKNWSSLNVDSRVTPLVLGINIISLDEIVYMDDESYKALQVFNKFPHPSNFKLGTAQSAKEGLSLYGIFNRCCSKIGNQYLRVMLLNPTKNMEILIRRQDTIEFCNKPGNEEIVKNICLSLRYIKNVNRIMTRIKSLRAASYEWKLLFNTLYNAILICDICESQSESSGLISDLGSRNNKNLFQVAHHMNRVIDFELTNTQGRFTVNLGIDPELDKKKQIMMGLHELMSTTAKFELERLPEYVGECTMVYLPNLGYLLGVKAWSDNLNDQEKSIPNLKFVFQNNDYIYYKSKGCDELDRCIGDTHPEILAHEMRIMMRLTQFILQHLDSLSIVVKLCAELDCILSLAKVCKDNDYKRPVLTSEKIIKIKNGRHPLQELCADYYVPNDTHSDVNKNLISLLTGPNSCGKSIYLKQVALVVYMAHIGCFVPAEVATIGLIDQIYTRIQTVEDVSTRMSAFLIDLRQMSNAIRGSSSSSLVIVDEFGKGTSEVDGVALLASCINNFLFRGSQCPHVFVSTHFHDLIHVLRPSAYIKMMSLQYIYHEDKLIFLYKLVDGVMENSYAREVAQNTGIDESICDRAKIILDNYLDCYPKADEKLRRCLNKDKYINFAKNELRK
ncbi:mutS protein homolog 5-like [Arctopsyche grandis]|uniref:mutS protein homolog 5-like n=1 Tax=Arctopsyche grandis TaxID=121162 RepID=UPI00406DA4E8